MANSSQYAALRARALNYLSRREYSRAELSRKLTPSLEQKDREANKQTEALERETLLNALEQDGWLSDSRFAESLVHRRASRFGADRIIAELKRHHIDPALIDAASARLRDSEMTRAKAAWDKKFGALPTTLAERAKQMRFLLARGFSQAVIAKLLRSGGDCDPPDGN